MRYLTSLIIVVFISNFSTAQTYEVGAFLGGSNYIGDVGSSTYINPGKLVFGGIAKWNRSKRHAFRASFLYASVEANDTNGDKRREARGYRFENTIKELSLGIEFNFWEWYLYDGESQFTPYLYTGLTGFNYDYQALDDNDIIEPYDQRWSVAIPMVVGVKKTLGTNFVLGAEIGARYTFTDNIDGSNPNDEIGTRFGNLTNNDWYMFVGITLSYTWGRIPCYCAF